MTANEFMSKFNEVISKQIDIDPSVMGTAKAYFELTGSEVYILIDLFKSVFMTADTFILAVKEALDILASNGNDPMEKMYFTKISDDIMKESLKNENSRRFYEGI